MNSPSSEQPSYVRAFLRHPTNRSAMLAAGCAAIFASIPFGLPGFALVGVLALGTEVLAALAIPGLPSFRAKVDREHVLQQRLARQGRLMVELNKLSDEKSLATHRHMASRVQSLKQAVGERGSALTPQDIDKLEDMLVDYLGLCVVHQSLRQRKDSVNEETLAKRIAALQSQLERPGLPDDEARQLRSALAEYTDSASRARRLAVRRSALEATLLAMPDKVEEVYQLVVSAPYSTERGSKLEDSLARLRIAEEVAAEFGDFEAAEIEPRASTRGAAASAAAPAAGAAQRAAKAVGVGRK